MQCEMCGKESKTEPLLKTMIEGTTLVVCKACAKFGQVVHVVRSAVKTVERKQIVKPTAPTQEEIETIVEDAGERVRKAREKKDLRQVDLGRMLAEKESIIQKIETGSFTPNIALARKLEKALNIVLIELVKEEVVEANARSAGVRTLGDMISKAKKVETE